jgi:hypothetical protein
VVVYTVASTFLQGRDGIERIKGSEKILTIVEAVRKRNPCPFKKVIIDGLTSWNDVILSEVLGVTWEDMPSILGWGKVSMEDYTERSERMMRYLKPVFALPCDVWVIAQERDHNPPKETDKKGKMRPVQSKLMRDVHPIAQQGSFWSLALGDSAALDVQNACDFVMQLYEEEEYIEEIHPPIEINGQVIQSPPSLVATGKRVKRLRTKYHVNYASRVRGDYRVIPEYIEAPTPEERYAAFMDIVSGKTTKWGKY